MIANRITTQNGTKSRLLGAFSVLGLVIVIALLLITTYRGLDFGDHWDEPEIIRSVDRTLQNGVLLPGWYYKPSLPFDLSLISLIPGVGEFVQSHGIPQLKANDILVWSKELRSHLINFCWSSQFLLRNRLLFAVISSLSLIWVYLLVVNWRNDRVEALLAAAILGLSWEVAYHLRWAVADGLMMQFGMLAIFLLMTQEIKLSGSKGSIKLAAFVSGLTTGTKYTGILLMVPVVMVAINAYRQRDAFPALGGEIRNLMGLFLAGYLLSTPGTLLDPGRFWYGIVLQGTVYGHGHNGAHNVGIGFDHLGRMLHYFASAVSSPFIVTSGFFALLGTIGLVSLIRLEPRRALTFLIFPALYLLLFAMHRVMFVRNLLILIPIWAILCARGVFFLADYFKEKRYIVLVLGVAVTVSLLANVTWLVYAGESIHNRSKEADLREFVDYLQAHSGSVELSEQLVNELKQAGITAQPHIGSAGPRDPAFVAFRRFEIKQWDGWPLKWPNNIMARFGAYDANIEYYPDNRGHNHILVMARSDAVKLGIVEHRAESSSQDKR